MEPATRRQIAATLVRNGLATTAEVADAVAGAWARVDHDLSSIIGPARVAALYARSLHVCSGRHEALAPARAPVQRTLDTGPLHAVLLTQSAAGAAMLGADVLQTFHDLLSRMVGQSLTERLLRPVWDDLSGASPAEDPLP